MRDTVILLGVFIDRLTLDSLLDTALDMARSGRQHVIMYANVHCLNMACTDLVYRRTLNLADVVYCDGTGVVWGAWLAGQHLPERMTGADWIYPLCLRCAAESVSLYLLGGRPGVAERAANRLTALYPDLSIVGTHHGYIHDSPADNMAAIEAANRARPDILLMGMGTPLQEKWIAAYRPQLKAPVVWAVGGLFDFVAGVQPRGPRWMLDHGLEWLYRLLSDPRRLWRRYLLGNPRFVVNVILQRTGIRHFPIEPPSPFVSEREITDAS
jgi:N-acetylglucosaminyldiphosphoundecaprenol N-acetyl-beta-D-mannosaminyltransferase